MTDTRSADSPASAGETQPSEFEDAFSAFANGDEPAPASEPAPSEPSATPQEPAAAEPAPRADPAPRTEEAAPSGPAPQSAEIDWSSVPPAVREAYEAADRERKTHRETLSRQGRELHDLRSRPAAPQPPAAPTPPAAAGPDEEALKALREDYPEIAGPLLDIIDGLRSQVTGTAQEVESARTRQALDGNVAALDQAMPDWRTWGADQRFEEWIGTQPRYVQEAAARNAQDIVDVAEAADVLTRFKSAYSTAAAPTPPTPDPTRDRRLAAGADASTKQPAAASGVPEDFEGAFKSFSAKAEKKRT